MHIFYFLRYIHFTREVLSTGEAQLFRSSILLQPTNDSNYLIIVVWSYDILINHRYGFKLTPGVTAHHSNR